MMMKILVVDDHILFREGLVNMLSSQPDMTVIGEAGTVAEAVAKARETRPDLILLDYSLPDGNGPDAARTILSELPKANVVFLTVHDAPSYLLAAIRAGAIGYLVKDVPFSKLATSIRAVAQDEPALSRKMTLSLMRELAHSKSPDEPHDASLADLTSREINILRDLAQNASNEEIAEHLSISIATVKNNIHNIFLKLNLRNRKELARFARQQGLWKKERN